MVGVLGRQSAKGPIFDTPSHACLFSLLGYPQMTGLDWQIKAMEVSQLLQSGQYEAALQAAKEMVVIVREEAEENSETMRLSLIS